MERLTKMGADFVKTQRGGETTYHGPGQLVIYPLLDLGRMKMSVRDYISLLQ
jgi:lipoyl(octanoyl) transferase 2